QRSGPAKVESFSGVARVVADKSTGHGVLYLIETFPTDTTRSAFQKKDRRYSVLLVTEAEDGVTCRQSLWEPLLSSKKSPQFVSMTCEFFVGNLLMPELVGQSGRSSGAKN